MEEEALTDRKKLAIGLTAFFTIMALSNPFLTFRHILLVFPLFYALIGCAVRQQLRRKRHWAHLQYDHRMGRARRRVSL